MASYEHQNIEKKWQQEWETAKAFATPEVEVGDPNTYYILNMFPYPSGAGLHVGHLLGYTGTDIIARTARMQGKKVLHPMGWDAFGLPAENFAIKSGVHPAISTQQNTIEFKRQFRQAGISYDWSKEINTSEPEYYKWTQWLFTLLYERGLAYRKEGMVNWCPKDQTVLANEQVVGGHCDRCGTPVIQRNLKQWYFKITDYAERLLHGLDQIEWPEKIKTMQRNWIGKSEGLLFTAPVKDTDLTIQTFSAHYQACYADTFVVIAPEHKLLPQLLEGIENKEEILAYAEELVNKRALRGFEEEKESEGVFTGRYIVDPLGNGDLPIWVASFALADYGTGIVKCSAHDERDFAFAKKYKIPLKVVLVPEDPELRQKVENFEVCYADMKDGILLEPSEVSGMKAEEATPAIIKHVEEKGFAVRKTTYRLRDWLVSRQRFWGSPIPIVYDEEGNERLITEDELPIELPMDVEFKPTGQSPLFTMKEWRTVTDKDGKVWTREADTLDGFVCSSWYYLRYPKPHLATSAFDKDTAKTWLPVNIYSGGAEHAVLHLLYARFITKVLFDAGLLDFEEPFTSLRNQGMILGPDHQKMSKSKGNVINPDDVVKEFGADTMRTYEMFMAPFDTERPWSTKGIIGVRRFLDKVWRLQEKVADVVPSEIELRSINRAIKKVTEDIAGYRFNTAVSTMMETVNELLELESISKETYSNLILILNPFAPHITEELWQIIGNKGFCSLATWPIANESYLGWATVEYPVQINGKVRFKLTMPADSADEDVLDAVRSHERFEQSINGQEIIKEIVIPGRLVSLVTKSQ